MKYKYSNGLIGKNIQNSVSKTIYQSMIQDKDYKVIDIRTLEELEEFFYERNFSYVNVTVPYKKEVLKYLDEYSDYVRETSACNLILNKGGKLVGYNTDVYGFLMTLRDHNVSVRDKNVLILGNGATSRTVKLVLEREGARNIYIAARHNTENEYTFNSALKLDVNIVVNTTPTGKKVNENNLVELSVYKNLETVIDLSYIPFKSNYLLEAKELGKGAINGYSMLFNQARLNCSFVKRGMLFRKKDFELLKADTIFSKLNVVFVGMPMSGKTETVKKLASHELFSNFVSFDTDDLVQKYNEQPIKDLILKQGLEFFRNEERKVSEVINTTKRRLLVATGGGTIIDRYNYQRIARNAIVVYLKRTDFTDFKDDNKRPLYHSINDLNKTLNERYKIYERRSDITLTYRANVYEIIQGILDAIFNS